jgi:hypothetical protein
VPLAILGIALIAGALLLPGFLVGPSLDAAIFTHIGGQLRDGVTLYTGTWDHKPPGIYLLYAAGQALLPFLDPWLVSWGMSFLATVGSGIALLAVLRSLGLTPAPAFLATAGAVAGMAQYLTALGGGLTEPIAMLPLTTALLLALGDRGGGGLIRSTVIGLLLGAAAVIAIPAFPGALVVALVAIALRHGWRERLSAAVAVVAGGLLPIVAVLAWLAATGALAAGVEAILGYAAAYRLMNQVFGATLSAPTASWTTLSYLYLIAPAILGVFGGWRAGGLRRPLVIACLGWLAISIGLFVYQGRFFAHYAIPLAMPLGVLAAFGLERVAGLVSRSHGPARVPLYAPFILTLLISIGAAFVAGGMELPPVRRDHERSTALAPVIQRLTGDGEEIWVWGNETEIYLAADRPSATSYSYLYPLVTPGYTTPATVARALGQLEADPPALIVDAGSVQPGWPGFQQLLIPRPLVSDGRDLDILDPLRDFVRANYEQGDVVDGWVIYLPLASP